MRAIQVWRGFNGHAYMSLEKPGSIVKAEEPFHWQEVTTKEAP
jgi:hypothetical protein